MTPRRTGVLFLLAVVVTAGLVQWSMVYGRLSIPPTYDDVAYLLDAARRLDGAYKDGPWAYVRGWVADPPHAPFSTLAATLAFALLGQREWAPYAFNVIVLFAFLLYIDACTREASSWIRAAVLTFALSFPAAAFTVLEFRPDMMAAILVAAGVVAALDWPLGTRHEQARVGVLFGLSALAKPSLAFLSFGLLGVALAGRALADAREGERWPGREQVRRLVPVAAIAVLIAAPHFVLTGRYYVRYFRAAIFDEAKPIMAYAGDLGAQLAYYVTGPGGAYMLGGGRGLLWLAVALASLDYVNPARRWRTGGLFAAAAAAWAVPTISPVKQPFFGLAFDYLLFGLAARALARLSWPSGAPRLFRPTVAAMVVVALTGVVLARARAPQARGPREGPLAVERRHLAEAVYEAVYGAATVRTVVFSFASLSAPYAVEFMGLTRGRSDVQLINRSYSGDAAVHQQTYERADLVLVAEPHALDVVQTILSTPIQEQLLGALRARPDFGCSRRIETSTGGSIFVFARRTGFSGWRPVTGMLPREGPYPRSNLPEVHWATGPQTRLALDVPRPGPYRLVLSGRTHHPEQAMEVRVNGRLVGRASYTEAWRLERVAADLVLEPGPNELRLDFARWQKDAGDHQRAVLFSELRLEWAGPDPCAVGETVSAASGPSSP